MPKIESVWLNDDKMLTELNNGQKIWLSVKAMSYDPRLSVLIANDWERFKKPKTDGNRVYWPDGPDLTITDILEILRTEEDATGGGGAFAQNTERDI